MSDGCGGHCEPTCDDAVSGLPKACSKLCSLTPKCVCQKGLYRNSQGKCVSKAACVGTPPPTTNCGSNEVLNPCGAGCDKTCDYVLNGPYACKMPCTSPACTCQDGFYRNEAGQCVSATQCQSGPTPPQPCKSTLTIGGDCFQIITLIITSLTSLWTIRVSQQVWPSM